MTALRRLIVGTDHRGGQHSGAHKGVGKLDGGRHGPSRIGNFLSWLSTGGEPVLAFLEDLITDGSLRFRVGVALPWHDGSLACAKVQS